jgi:DNA repair protein RecO (recombination protein O)
MRVSLEPAFILHRRAYRESSFLLETLTEHHGRTGLIARGARRQARAVSELQPFQPLLLSWSGRGELPIVSGAEGAGSAYKLHEERLYSGFYVNEITLRLIARGDPDPELFHAYGRALHGLAGDQATEAVLRIYEKHLLKAAGYAMVLDTLAHQAGPIRAEQQYQYVADVGPMETAPPYSDALTIRGATLLALHSETLNDPEILREAKRFMRFVLRPHLGSRPLRSRELFRRYPP